MRYIYSQTLLKISHSVISGGTEGVSVNHSAYSHCGISDAKSKLKAANLLIPVAKCQANSAAFVPPTPMQVNWECSQSSASFISFSSCVSTEAPQKDGETAASSYTSDSASDAASLLFHRWGHDLGPESRRVALKKFRYYGYNSYLSDRISLTRPIPDLRPDGSVELMTHNYQTSLLEAASFTVEPFLLNTSLILLMIDR